MPDVHAFLSASSSGRWIACPPSAKLCASKPDAVSSYAQQGTDGLLHIVDFKYGLGVLVSAVKNTQLMCYALGAYDAFGSLYPIDHVKLSIFQPRREHFDTYEMPLSELLTCADEVLVPAARLAIEGTGDFKAGDHCQFCKVKATCRERASYNMELARYEFTNPDLLDDADISEILSRVDSLVSWASDVKEYALM